MTKIDWKSFATDGNHRSFDDMEGLVGVLRRHQTVWSWGAHAWTKMNDYCLRFKVQGHHHYGHIYLVVNGRDLFDIYLTSLRGTVREHIEDVYLDSLIEVIDDKVERIAAYKQ
jgi:hypothetical protein